MKNRVITLALAVMFVLALFAGCSPAQNTGTTTTTPPSTATTPPASTTQDQSDDMAGKAVTASGVTFNLEGFPIVDEVIQLKGFAGRAPEDLDWEEVYTRKRYEEMTNVDITWELADVENINEVRGVKLASGDLPDFFYQSRLTVVDQMQYGEIGFFIALNDLIDQYAPNLKAALDKEPDARAMWTMPNSAIYSVSDIRASDNFLSLQPQKWWIYMPAVNDYNGGVIPSTIDEFYDWMMAAKEANPELTPFSSHRLRWIVNQLKGTFGMGNGSAYTHQYVSLNEDTNELYLNMTAQNSYDMLVYLNKLYTSGILDPNIFTQEMASYVANGAEYKYYAIHGNTPNVFNFLPEEYNDPETGWYCGMTLSAPGYNTYNSCYMPNSFMPGQFVITNECEVPEILIRWIDWFFSEEGAVFISEGEEGQGYDIVDGLRWNDQKYGPKYDGKQYVSNASYPVLYVSMEHTMGTYDNSLYFSEGSPYLKGMQAIYAYKPTNVWGAFTYTSEEAAEMAILETDIVNYVLEVESKLIAGEMGFDQWDTIQSTLKAMGVDRYMEIYNTAYHRMYN